MATINNQGVNIYYEHHEHDTSLPTVLLSHGYSATSAMWQGQAQALGSIANVITWDMRGHGQSDSPEDQSLYSEAWTVSDMAFILKTFRLGHAIIGGLSLGGYMSLAFHYAYPEQCDALMLFDTGPGYKNDQARAGWNKMAEERAKQLEKEGLAALGTDAEIRISQHRSAAGLAKAARGMLVQADDRIIQSLPGIQVPTMVLVGDQDKPFLGPSNYMAGKINGAKEVVLENAGHAANVDQPAAFNQAVIEFVSSLNG